MSLADLNARIAAVNDVLCASSVLVWDSRTMMPAGGAASRSHQIATLTGLARDLLIADDTRRALDGAERAVAGLPEDHPDRRSVAAVREAVAFHSRIPAALVARRAAVRGLANAAWVQARATNDFALFTPHLEATLALAREFADAAGWQDHPYDALLQLYEPGESITSLRRLFARLRDGLAPILQAARARTPRTDFLHRGFAEEGQRAVARSFAQRLGYDFARGRLDTTVHPFEVSFTREDVRITTRYRPDALAPALFGAMHETGHALYEQNIDPAYTRTALATDLMGLYAVGGTSFGVHESQSRLWENHVGRSRSFWRLHFAEVRNVFPDALGDVDASTFHAAVNAASPGLIRTEADELTYDFHIMLRVELEASLIAGDIAVADIPGAWAAAMREQLGLEVPDDRSGCLQDIHWSSGMIGSFCSYTIGNVMAAQLFAAARGQVAGLDDALARGDYAPLRDWLRAQVWQHGRRFGRDEILRRATGSGLSPEPYLGYLSAKFASG
ncbi:carboxypeptidase M32 [Limobrevibacterium gyesilva]|uniref:Metal-dependent carboxypeptidase n=1 Tax=Limobrevibacterium gyesilva TaxID=2991712 RepID=A0AA41YLI5_9PROT|nr:carboxypeptidase M32 [Limobrevibacterium gyesilva]MCW3475659.1 carboxypeptidase M32 [Limobrevibacterium gyesilva]